MIPGVGVGAGGRDATAAAISPAVPPPLSSAGALVVSGAGGALVEAGASTVGDAEVVVAVMVVGAIAAAVGVDVSVPHAEASKTSNSKTSENWRRWTFLCFIG